ncbi:MAG: NAD(P)-dependent oxidoreductase [Pseudomonadota bacterium]
MILGFIGLGMMGQPMAGHLMAAGHDLVVHTRTRTKADALIAQGARWAESPAQTARTTEVVLTMVGGPNDVAAIYRGDHGLLAAARPGQVLVDLTTSSPDLAAALAQEAQEAICLDAPVTGGVKGAQAGKLSLMVGGDVAALDRVRPVLERFAGAIRCFGPPGAGQHAKLVNQTAVAGIMLGLAEALAYAQRAGLDGTKMLETLGSGTACSFLLDAYGQAMLRGDEQAGFFVDHFVKDLTLAARAAEQQGLAPLGVEAALDAYRALSGHGLGHAGIQSLMRHYLARD